MEWWLWLIIGVAALIGESLSMALYLLFFGVAALAAMVLALVQSPAAAQLAVFSVLAVALIGLLRPRILALLGRPLPRQLLTNQGRLLNRVGNVEQVVTQSSGLVRFGGGEYWTARPYPPITHIAVGSAVQVMYVDGLVAHVRPVAQETATDPAGLLSPDSTAQTS